jgi:hypothetical protein
VVTPIAVLAVALGAARHLFDYRLPAGHDAAEHALRVAEFARSLEAGIWLPQWAPNLAHGYGEPIFVFNPPLFYLLASLPVLAGWPVALAVNVATAMLVVVAALGMYAWTKPVLGRSASLVAATSYAWAPYVLLDIYVRQALPELAAAALLPWALWGLSMTIRMPGPRRIAAASLAIGATLLTSTPASLVIAPALAGQILVLVDLRRPRPALRGLAALGLGAMLAAAFWVPATSERQVMRFDRLLDGLPAYANHFLEAGQLVTPGWGYGPSLPGLADRLSFGQGEAHLGLAVVGMVVVLAGRARGLAGRQACLAVALVVFGAFMSLEPSAPLWHRLEPLGYLQFPWRFLLIVAAGISVLAALPSALIARSQWAAGAAAAGACAMILVLGSWTRAQPIQRIDLADSMLSPEALARRDRGLGTAHEYETIWVGGRPETPAQDRLIVRSGSASIAELRSDPQTAVFNVRAHSRTRLRLNTHYFPGWRVYVDQAPVPLEFRNPSALIELTVMRGEHYVEARYEQTDARRLGLGISMAATGAVGFLALGWQPRRRVDGGREGRATTPAPAASGSLARRRRATVSSWH